MTASPDCPVLDATACVACGTTPTATIPDASGTPLCAGCVERIGVPLAIGERAVCRVGSYAGVVRRFDEGTWADSILAELRLADGGCIWLPLADLAPAR